jgi:hypothetical protein
MLAVRSGRPVRVEVIGALVVEIGKVALVFTPGATGTGFLVVATGFEVVAGRSILKGIDVVEVGTTVSVDVA